MANELHAPNKILINLKAVIQDIKMKQNYSSLILGCHKMDIRIKVRQIFITDFKKKLELIERGRGSYIKHFKPNGSLFLRKTKRG